MPYVPQDLLDRVASLEREVRQLRGRAQMRPALNQVLAGDVVIGEGGQLIAKTPGGQRTFVVGQTPQGDWGVGLARESGAAALTVGDDVNSADAQMIRMWSRGGEIIVMDDAYADGYLGRPYVPIPMAPGVNIASDTDTPLYSGHMVVQHKVLSVNGQIVGPAGTAIRVWLTLDGTELAAWTLSSSATVTEINQRIPLSATDHPHSSTAVAVIWAQRTAGTGTGTVRVRGLWGMNTITESEAT